MESPLPGIGGGHIQTNRLPGTCLARFVMEYIADGFILVEHYICTCCPTAASPVQRVGATAGLTSERATRTHRGNAEQLSTMRFATVLLGLQCVGSTFNSPKQSISSSLNLSNAIITSVCIPADSGIESASIHTITVSFACTPRLSTEVDEFLVAQPFMIVPCGTCWTFACGIAQVMSPPMHIDLTRVIPYTCRL